jgi:small subunit ribosomal protein S2
LKICVEVIKTHRIGLEEIIMANDKQFLVPQDVYLKAGIHIGTKFRTKYMEQFIYKTRPDGLSVLNLQKIDERIRIAAKFLSQYEPADILVVSRRENGWKSVRAFGKATGTKVFAGRYPPGILTNPALETYMEFKVIFVTDSWPDRNAIKDAMTVGIPVIALCDTNNQSNNIDLVVPCNNKGKKALGLFFYILAREYLKHKGAIKSDEEFKEKLEDFTEE